MTIITAIPMLMTTNKPPASPAAAAAIDAIASRDAASRERAKRAALYRLMTWLSPAFPVGAFSYSSGIEWAVEAGDIVDAASLRDWLAAMLADGTGILRRRVSGAGASRRVVGRRRRRCARSPNWRRPSCRRASASSRPRRRAAPSSTSRASAWNCDGLDRTDRGLRRRDRLSRRGRPRQRRACDPAGADDACVPSCAGVELDFRRRAAGSAGADRQPARAGGAGAGRRRDRQRARSRPRSTISAAPPFAPTSPACGTRRNIRGCSGHEQRSATSL